MTFYKKQEQATYNIEIPEPESRLFVEKGIRHNPETSVRRNASVDEAPVASEPRLFAKNGVRDNPETSVRRNASVVETPVMMR